MKNLFSGWFGPTEDDKKFATFIKNTPFKINITKEGRAYIDSKAVWADEQFRKDLESMSQIVSKEKK